MDLALLLLQAGGDGGATAVGLFRFFAGFLLVITFFCGFLGFTYWISKDE
ncbi:MAG TPA: hypothetical protein VFY59_17485 [Rubrobacter sp.]|nr:hypothetical protein [Rubrobacter sp.]